LRKFVEWRCIAKAQNRALRCSYFKFSRLCTNLANLIDRRSSTHGRRPMPSASPLIFCQVHFLPQVLWPLATLGTRGHGRRINIAAAVARRTLGQIVFAGLSVHTPCCAVSYVFQADCQSSLPIRLRSDRSSSERNRACRFLVVSIKTSFGFRSEVGRDGRTPPRLNSISHPATRSGTVACSY